MWKLHKALYGLKQAGREWWSLLALALQDFDLIPATADNCLWYSHSRSLAVVTVVDDLAIAGTSSEVESLIVHLERKFKIKRLGKLNVFVGLEVSRQRAERTITLRQERYARAILARFGMTDVHSVKTPIPQKVYHHSAIDASDLVDTHDYQSHVGSIMFLMLATRADLAYACGVFSRYNSKPTNEHLAGVKHVLRYIAGTD